MSKKPTKPVKTKRSTFKVLTVICSIIAILQFLKMEEETKGQIVIADYVLTTSLMLLIVIIGTLIFKKLIKYVGARK